MRLKNDSAYIAFFNTANNTRTGYLQYNAGGGGDLRIMGEVVANLALGTGGVDRLKISSAGNVGIGTTPSAKLTVSGDITATGNITAYFSDERLKKGLEPIKSALNKIKSLRAVTYYQNELADTYFEPNTERQVGVIAQDIQKILPEAVKPAPFDVIRDENDKIVSKSGKNYLTVQYEKVVPLLIAGIQELNDKVNNLEEQLKNK